MSKALSEFIRQCEPVPIPAAWQHFGSTNPLVFRPPVNLEAVLVGLRELFDVDELLACGLLQHSLEGAVVNEALRDANAWVLPHVDPELGEVIGISTAAGLLTAEGACRSRSLEMALNHEQRSEAEPRIFIVFGAPDLALFTSLGCATRTSDLIVGNNPQELEAICAHLGWDSDYVEFDCDHLIGISELRATEQYGVEADGYSESMAVSESYSQFNDYQDLEVILVGWTLAVLSNELPPGLLATVDFLKQVQAVLGYDLLNVNVWRPSDVTLEGFRFAFEHGTPRALQRLLYDCLIDERQSLHNFTPNPREPLHFADVFDRVMQLAGRRPDSAEFGRAVSELQKVQSRELIRPLLEMTVPVGPVGRSLREVAAILQQHALTQYLDVVRATAGGQHEKEIEKKTAGMLATCDRVLRSLKYLGDRTW